MASATSITPLRQMLEGPLAQFSNEVERLFEEARGRARRELADQLNQAVRRMRQAETLDELGAALVDVAGAFATGAALFHIEGKVARGERIRGVSGEVARAFRSLEIPLSSAAALASAVESRDPVIAATTVTEVSGELAELLSHPPDSLAAIYPLTVEERVTALLYAWGDVQGSVLELFTQIAAAVWRVPAAPATELVAIAPAPAPSATTWENLTPEEQQMHLRAQRFARVQVAEMRLSEAAAVQSGRAQRNLYQTLRPRIDAARATLRESFFASCPSMVDYLHLELLRTFAHDDPDLLGKDYPGPVA